MNRFEPGWAAHVYDYSTDPRLLLGLLADPMRDLRSEWVPLVHVRRGWLHGSHLVITVRSIARTPVDLEDFAAVARQTASQLAAEPPSEHDYRARAEELARWEVVSAPLLPLHPQGHVTVGPAEIPERWSDDLLDARDQLTARLLEPMLGSAALPAAALLPHATRVLALCALAHPYGVGMGALPLRSHTEGIWSATGGTADLRTAFSERYEKDRAVFLAALKGPDAFEAADGEAAVLRSWNEALHSAWGMAMALAASGSVDDEKLAVSAPRKQPLDNGVPSPFHRAARLAKFHEHEPAYWHLGHRMLLNVLYGALSTLGITPIQRYYLCFGISTATDELLGEDWSVRLERFRESLPDVPART